MGGEHACDNLYGLYIWLASGMPVTRVESNGRVIGSLFEDDHARYCRLTGLLPGEASHGRSEQTDAILDDMTETLARNDMAFSDVFRTWFYNHDILDWYDEFNRVRNRFFHARKVYDGVVPASTGIGGGNVADAALVAGLLALKPKDPGVKVFAVPSPLQSSAHDYGSSFSRAVEVEAPDHRRLYVSGTASIDREGRTVFLDNTKAQVRLTMEVVQAILQSRSMDWADVTRSLAYFKRASDAPLLAAHCREQALPSFPVIVAKTTSAGTICCSRSRSTPSRPGRPAVYSPVWQPQARRVWGSGPFMSCHKSGHVDHPQTPRRLRLSPGLTNGL